MENFVELLNDICQHPEAYIGSASLRALAHFLSGYRMASLEPGNKPVMVEWKIWIEKEFSLSSPAYGWSRILLYEYGSELKVFEVLPHLYEKYLVEMNEIGFNLEELDRRWRARLETRNRADEIPEEERFKRWITQI